jgi:hypothetical protein
MFGLYWLASKSVLVRDVFHWFQTIIGSFLPCQVIARPLPTTLNHAYFQGSSGKAACFVAGRIQMFQVVAAKSKTRLRVKSLAPHPLTASPLDTLLPPLSISHLSIA